jgi:hypothetical protein
MRAAAATAAVPSRFCAIQKWNAVPSPVPKTIAAPTTWAHFTRT